MTAVQILLTLSIIPVLAIVSRTWLQMARLRHASNSDLQRRLDALEAENDELRERLENVEVIVTDADWAPPTPEERDRTLGPRPRTRRRQRT
ncbi:MAG: hypothetical protein AAF533_24790 [Acidobacteriota bacterium]